MTNLKAMKPTLAGKKRVKMLVFSKSGVGKTWTALDFPNCYYIDTEGGADKDHYTEKLIASGGVYFGKDDGSQNFDEVIGQVKALATEKHQYKTLVIDSISKLFNITVAESLDLMIKRKQDVNKTFGSEKKTGASYSKILMDWISKVDMNVILIAHQKIDYGDDGGKEKQGYTFDAWDKTDYELDLVARIVKRGGSRYAEIIKSREKEIDDGESLGWSYKTFKDIFGSEGLEAEAKPLELATPEQITELQELLKQWQAKPSGWEQKVLSKSSSDDWKDMASEKMASTINFIKGKINGN